MDIEERRFSPNMWLSWEGSGSRIQRRLAKKWGRLCEKIRLGDAVLITHGNDRKLVPAKTHWVVAGHCRDLTDICRLKLFRQLRENRAPVGAPAETVRRSLSASIDLGTKKKLQGSFLLPQCRQVRLVFLYISLDRAQNYLCLLSDLLET